MKQSSNRLGLLLVVVAVVFALMLAPVSAFGQTIGTNSDQTPSNAPGVTSITISPAQQQAALNYWTHAAVASAKPMVMVDQGSPAVADQAASSEAAAVGLPGFSPSGLAAPGADQAARAAYSSDWSASADNAATLAPDGTSQVFTSYIVNSWAPAQTIYPHKWVGRLSFKTAGGTSYCSATAISGNVMLTAAHCLYDTTNNVWYSGWAFQPAYRNGSAPYGTFVASTCWVLTAWVNLTGGYSITGWTKYDVGVCKMGKNSAGQTLNSAVGWMGRQWNFGYVRNFFDLGYPWQNTSLGALVDAGKYLRTCTAESFLYTTDTMGMGCNWGPGISGGPWMANYAPPLVSGNANSVNSGLYVGQMNLYGIRFTSGNIVVLCQPIYANC